MSSKRGGLGKGTQGLKVPQSSATGAHPLAEAVGRDTEALRIPLSLIDPDPTQPRKVFEEGALQELAESIRTHGLLQAVLVRQVGERYQLIAGERRYRAAHLLGLEDLPARVARNATEVALLSLLENLQREDLGPVEEAHALDRLRSELGFKQNEIAEKINKSPAFVSERLAILSYPPEVIQLLEQKPQVLREAREIARDQNPTRRRKKIEQLLAEGEQATPRKASKTLEPIHYRASRRGFDLRVQYRKGKTDVSEVIRQLEEVLERLKAER